MTNDKRTVEEIAKEIVNRNGNSYEFDCEQCEKDIADALTAERRRAEIAEKEYEKAWKHGDEVSKERDALESRLQEAEKELKQLQEIHMIPERPEYPGFLRVGQELIDRSAKIKELEARLAEREFVPGHHKCPKCGFYQVSSILHPNGISPNKETPEQCPNDGTEMMSVTWQEHARDNYEGACKQAERAYKAEAELSRHKACVEALVDVRNRLSSGGWGICGATKISRAQFYSDDLERINEALASLEGDKLKGGNNEKD